MIARPKLAAGLMLALAVCTTARAGDVLVENFDNLGALTPGWVIVNNSAPKGQSWFQGNPAIFGSQSGAADSYAAANYLSAAPSGGDISLWALTPVLSMNNGGQITFYTRTEGGFPGDNLDILMSTNGSSTDVGSTPTSLGDFTTLLQTIPGSDYPSDWTKVVITISGLSGPSNVRFGFRYWVTDTTVNGDYIGIDTLSVTAGIPEPSTLAFVLSGLALVGLRRWRASRLG